MNETRGRISEVFARSDAQRLQALVRANDVRSRRAQLKRDVFAGDVSAADVLRDPPEWAARMRVVDVLLAQRGWGLTRVRRVMLRLRISDSKTAGGLSPRQRVEVTAVLETAAPKAVAA